MPFQITGLHLCYHNYLKQYNICQKVEYPLKNNILNIALEKKEDATNYISFLDRCLLMGIFVDLKRPFDTVDHYNLFEVLWYMCQATF